MQAGLVEIEMRMNLAKLAKDLSEAKSMVGGMTKEMENMASMAKKALGLLGVGLTVNYFKNLFEGAIAAAEAVGKLTEKVGGSAGAWSGILAAGKAAGASFETIEAAALRLTRAMSGSDVETKGAGRALARLGVDARDSAGNMKPTEQVMLEIAKALAKYEDGAGKAAVMQDIFGKGAGALIPTMRELAERGDKVGKTTDEMAEAAIRYTKQVKQLDQQKGELVRTITFAVLPAVIGLINAMLELRKQTSGVNDAVKSLSAEGKIEEWAWAAVKFVALVYDAFTKLIDTIKLVPAVIKVMVNDIAADAVPFADQIGWFMKLTDAGKEHTRQIAEARKEIKGYVEDTKKGLLEAVQLQEQASNALKGRTGPQFWDQRDRELNRPKASLSDYTSADPKEKKAVAEVESAYRTLLKTLKEKLLVDVQLTEVNKLQLSLDALSKKQKETITEEEIKQLRVVAAQVDALERRKAQDKENKKEFEGQVEMQKEYDEAMAVSDQKRKEAHVSAETYLADMQRETNMLQLSNDEREIAIALHALEVSGIKATSEEYARLEPRIRAAISGQQAMRAEIERQKNYPALIANAWKKAGDDIADSLTKAFGSGGAAVGGMVKAYADSQAKMIEIDERYRAAREAKGADLEALDKKQNDERVQNSLESYGQIAGAAKGFFDEQSTAYKVLSEVERAMYLLRFAMQAQAMVQDLLFTNSSVANSGVRAAADGVAAVAKTLASLPFPFNLAAAAVVVGALAAIGVAVAGGGGGGGVSTAEQRQKEQGTGTVLGDSSAKSASLTDSIKEIERIDKIGLTYTHDMLESLLKIQDSMAGVAAAIYRTTGTSGGGMGIVTDSGRGTSIVDKIVGFFYRTSTEITDTGLKFFGNLGEMIKGSGIEQYATVKSQSSFLGIKTGSSTSEVTAPAAEAVRQQLAMVFKGITDSVEAAAKGLGQWTDGFRDAMLNIALTINTVSFKDLKGQDLQDALNNVLSAASDQLAATMLPGFEEFQKVGEGYFQTIMRVATENELAINTLNSLGLSVGLTGIEAVKARLQLIEFAGGAEEFAKSTQSFFENYYTEAERFRATGADLAAEFERLNLPMPTTIEGFRALIESQDLTTESGQKMTAELLRLNPAFAAWANSVVGLDGKLHSLEDVTNQHISLQERLAVAQRNGVTSEQIERQHSMNEAIDQYSVDLLNAIYVQEDANAANDAARERRNAEMSLEAQLMTAQGNAAGGLALQRQVDIEGMNAAEIASYDYQKALQTQIDAQTRTNQLQEQVASAGVELLQAQGDAAGALAAQRQIDIVGMNEEQVALYDLNIQMRAVATATKTSSDLWKQLYNLQHTEKEILANNRNLRMLDLEAQEKAANMVPGTLTNVQKQIDAQEDLNASMQRVTDAASAAGLSQATLASTISKGLEDGGIGMALSDSLVKGIEKAIRDQTANQIATIFYDGIVKPVIEQIVAGGAISQILSTANINTMMENARKYIAAMNAAFNSKEFKDLLALLKTISFGGGTTATTGGVGVENSVGGVYQAGQGLPGQVWISSGGNFGYWAYPPGYVMPGSGASEEQRLAMMLEIFKLAGDEVSAQIIIENQRRIALAKLAPELRGLQVQLWGLQDAAAAAAKATEEAKKQLEFANEVRKLQIDITRAQGWEEAAKNMERADQIAAINEQWGAGTDRANQLITMYQQLWWAQDHVVESGKDMTQWVQQITDWLVGLNLSDLSPLTAPQRFSVAEDLYIENLLKAQNGDLEARQKYTADADAYLREAAAMFGTSSMEYNRIFRLVQEQAAGLVVQGGGTVPATLFDVNTTLQATAETAKAQMDQLIAEVASLKAAVEINTNSVEEQTATLAATSETNTQALQTTVERSATGGNQAIAQR